MMNYKEKLIRSLKEKKFPENIINAFHLSDREKFIPKKYKESSYFDIPIPIGYGQTISQPYTIAFMLTLLNVKNNQKILEVGSGSGYVLDLLSKLSPHGNIFGIERIIALVKKSEKTLAENKNIKIIYGDGSKGLGTEAPFDRILVSATSKNIPQQLVNQLKIKGILVAPVNETLVYVKKDSGMNKVKEYPGFIFVPLIENFEELEGGDE